MFCARCRKNYPGKNDLCPRCGEELVPYARVKLTLDAETARTGSRQTVSFPCMFRPVTLSLIPGLKNGQVLAVKNARFSDGNGYFDTGVLEIEIAVPDEAPKAPPVHEKPEKKKRKNKRGGGFWARAAGCLAVLPVTVLMTIALYYFTARNVFEAAGRDELLVLGALSLGLLVLIRMTVRKETDTPRRNSLIITVSLLFALLLRYAPPYAGIDLASVAGKLRTSIYSVNGITPPEERPANAFLPEEPGLTPAPEVYATPAPAPKTAEPSTGTNSVIPNFEHRYFLNRLSPEELDNFTALYKSVASFSKVCVFPHEISRDSVDLLTTLLLSECPELMQVDFTAGYYTLSLFNGKISSMDIPYSMTREEYETKLAACRTLIGNAVNEMRGMSVYEKELYVYTLLVNACSYSLAAQDASNAYGALIAGHAKCDGISLAAKWLLEEADVTAVVLTGQEPGVTVGHAWNAVLIDGVFCHLDITNDTENDGAMLFPAFNVPENCLTDVYPYDSVFSSRFPLPSVQGYENSFHYRNGCFVSAGRNANDLLKSKGRALYKQGGGSFTVQFEREEDYRRFLNGLDSALSDLYYDTLKASGRYAYNMLETFRTVRITLNFD